MEQLELGTRVMVSFLDKEIPEFCVIVKLHISHTMPKNITYDIEVCAKKKQEEQLPDGKNYYYFRLYNVDSKFIVEQP